MLTSPPTRRSERRASSADLFQPLAIAVERCKGCSLCVSVCPKHALALDDSTVNSLGYHPVQLIDREGCTSCVLCARVCPEAAFVVYARPKVGAR